MYCTLTAGQMIWLKANKKEGWKRQQAKIAGVPGEILRFAHASDTTIVFVMPEKPHDDGMREITVDQIEFTKY